MMTEKQQQATSSQQQENILSAQLLHVHKNNRNFGIIMPFVITIILGPILLLINPKRLIWVVSIFPWALSLFSYVVWRHVYREIPQKLYYHPEGIRWITRAGKEVFVPWNDIREVEPLKAYGKIKVPDYMLFFRKPFPGYMPVSAEVAEKIREYMAKYKETEEYP